MKKLQMSRTVSILLRVTVCAWVGVAAYWVYLSFLSSLSAKDVRAEGESVAAVLEEYKSARGYYPRALKETRVSEMKFPVGVSFDYTPDDTRHGYILVATGGGHTWRYISALRDWQHVPVAEDRPAALAD